MAPRLSFVSALFNCLEHTRAMLESLERTVQWDDCEVILVDDGSTDGTRAFLETLKARPNYKIVLNDQNLGFAKSNNRGVAVAQSDTLVLINNDLLFSDGWLEPMLELLETLPDVGAVGNVQRNLRTNLVDHAGIFFDLEGMPTHAHKNRCNPPRGKWIERNAVTAACLAIKRSTFLEVGGFDESYRNGFEDVDLSMKLRKRGFRLYVALRSVIGHHISVSPGRNENNERNTEIFRDRWSDFAKRFGQKEWAREYFRRYARFWWRMNPQLACKAFVRLFVRGNG